jgi:hypothetical protein
MRYLDMENETEKDRVRKGAKRCGKSEPEERAMWDILSDKQRVVVEAVSANPCPANVQAATALLASLEAKLIRDDQTIRAVYPLVRARLGFPATVPEDDDAVWIRTLRRYELIHQAIASAQERAA